MSFVLDEIASQPACWRRAVKVAAASASVLPRPGERVAVVGCGTSWFMAQSYAATREAAGHGETDAFAASEWPADRAYDRVVAISRSGTTTEVLDLLDRLRGRTPTVALAATAGTPIFDLADDVILLDFADEQSVVQTRFATTALTVLRAGVGADLDNALRDVEFALAVELDPALVAAEQITFVGRGWTVGLAHEAALKMREAAIAWTESYPAFEYRHGPASITAAGRAVWSFGEPAPGLPEEVTRVGGVFTGGDLDPLAELVLAQRVAVAKATVQGLDPDRPRNLTRSVVLDGQTVG